MKWPTAALQWDIFKTLLLLSLLFITPAAPANYFVKNYLTKYGYMPQLKTKATKSDVRLAMKEFQADVGLPTNGRLTPETLYLMRQPRCGTPSVKHKRRTKRFVPYHRKWSRTTLTWTITDPQNVLKPYDKYVVRNSMHRAFGNWAAASRRTVRFKEKKTADEDNPSDITVFFARGSHNDTLPFDGKNGIVAHGFYPTNGNLHFDAAEKWTLNMGDGINLYQTAVHEIGHLLGLEHSTDYRAVMFPVNRPFDPKFRLSDDDVRGIRYLYTPWAWRYLHEALLRTMSSSYTQRLVGRRPLLRANRSYGNMLPNQMQTKILRRKSNSVDRVQTEMGPALTHLGRLVTAISASNLVGGSADKKTSPEEDLFLKRFSTRNVANFVQRKQSSSLTEERTNRQKWATFVTSHVIPPDGTFLLYWLTVVSLAVAYSWWILIVRESFGRTEKDYWARWLILDLIADTVFLMDIFVQFRTGYLEQGLVVHELQKLSKRYMASSKFWLDIASLIPADYMIRLIDAENFHPLIYRAPRLIKTYRVMAFYYIIETRTIYPNFIRVANLTHILLLSCHWFACFHYMIAQHVGFTTPRWFNERWTLDTIANVSNTRRYLLSLYWSTLTLTTIGNTSYPKSDWEYFFTIVSYLIGVFFFATIVGQVGNVITNRNASRQDFERMLDGSKQYMRNHNVPKSMQRRVRRWYDYSWSRGRMTGGSDIESLSVLPDKLKTELALHVNLHTLKKVHMFEECQPEFLHDLVLKMRAIIFTPGDIICRKGEVAREMYIIADGCLEVLDESGQVIRQMRAGDFFGEIGILSLDGVSNRRTADVRSVGYSELFSLSREDVLAAMKDYPEAKVILSEYGRSRLEQARPKLSVTPTSLASFTVGASPSTQRRSDASTSLSLSGSEPNLVDPETITKTVTWNENELEGRSRGSEKSSSDRLGAKVAVPSPVTNLLGVRVPDDAPSSIVKQRPLKQDVKRSVTLDTFKMGRERLVKGCDIELRKMHERLASLICAKLRPELSNEIASIRQMCDEFRQQLMSQDETINRQRREIELLRYTIEQQQQPTITVTDTADAEASDNDALILSTDDD